jgi:hypothetical protein
MKTKLFLAVAFFMFSLTMSYASFPVLRTKKAVVKTEIQTNLTDNSAEIYDTSTVDSEEYVAAAAKKQGKDKWVGVALWFFLGWPFAAHRWYYGKPTGANILFILTIGGLGIWAIIDLINMLTDNF